jgi:iron complex outermembrane receptor protein
MVQAQSASMFDLPAQPLADSLRAVASQTNTNILFDRALVAGLSAKSLKAKRSVADALKQLLNGTGLTYRRVDERTVTIVPLTATQAEDGGTDRPILDASYSDASAFRLAQANTSESPNPDTAQIGREKSDPSDEKKSADLSKKDQLEEVLVTAQKRTQRGQDVPIALSVVTSDSLERRVVMEVSDLTGLVPNVEANYGWGPVTFNIRGIGTNQFSSNFDSPVAINVDEGYLSKPFMNSLQLFDIDRVEVLKGPQGTLFGRNATGGAVNFYTRDPTDKATGELKVGYDNYHTVRTDVYLSGPVGGNFTARIAGEFVNQGEGYYNDTFLNVTEDKEKKWLVRGKLRWTDGDTAATTVQLTVNAGHQGGTVAPYTGVGIYTPASLAAGKPVLCPAYASGHADPGDANCVRGIDGLYPGDRNPFTSTNNTLHTFNSHTVGTNLRADHDFGSATLTSLATYLWFQRIAHEDSDGSPTNSINNDFNTAIHQFTQEIRLTSDGDRDRTWNYVVGGFYEHDNYENGDYLQLFNETAGLYSPFHQYTDALAVFFHNDVKLTDTLSLTAGVRYSNERIGFDGGTFSASGATGYPVVPTTLIAANSFANTHRRDDAPTFKIGVEYTPNLNIAWVDKTMFYANVSTGFRSGAYNGEFNGSQVELTSLAPEKITAYEGGIKSTVLDHKVQLNLSVFRYDFTNGFINVDSPTSPIPITINAASIKSYGGELDLQMRPISQLTLELAGSYLSSHIASDISVGGKSIDGATTIQSPKYTFDEQATWTQPLTDGYRLSISGDANWRSSQNFNTTGDPNASQTPYWIANTNVSIGPTDGVWSVGFFVKNISNSIYKTYINDLPSLGFDLFIYGNPRTYGIQTSVKF